MARTLDEYDNFDGLFEDVEKMIWGVCHDFVNKYGGSVEDLFADSGLYFMRAIDRYKPESGIAFTTVLHWAVWGGLMDTMKRSVARYSKLKPHDISVVYDMPGRSSFNVLAFKRSLSRDGALVIHLLTMLPGELSKAARQAGLAPESCKTNKRHPKYDVVRDALEEYLIDWGWDQDRLQTAFTEIEEMLNDN